MSITARPGATFEATLSGGAPSGLTGTVGVQILDNVGGVTVPRATTGISEFPAGSGFYTVTLTAPATAGQYTVFWDTGTITPATTASEDLTVAGVPVESPSPPGTPGPPVEGTVHASFPLPGSIMWIPDVGEVGARMYTRTRDADDNYAGTFTATTMPNATQVAALIEDAVGVVSGSIGVDLPDYAWPAARYAAIALTAVSIERGFFTSDDAPNPALQAWIDEYNRAIASLTTSLNRDQPNQSRIGMLSVRSSRPTRPQPSDRDAWWLSYGNWPA